MSQVLLSKGLKYLSVKHPLLHKALMHHRTHQDKPIRFNHHWYLYDLYKDNSENIVGIKSTQSGWSEWLICLSLHESSINHNVLYVSPTILLSSRFVRGRFNKTILNSEYYQSLEKEMNSSTMKSYGGIINFIGSNAQSGFAEFVANVVVIDELDYCNQANVAMSKERQSAQTYKRTVKVGNPTILNYGIDYEYNRSDKKLWFIKCECGNWINPDFFKHVVEKVDDDYIIRDKEWDINSGRDIYCLCDKCNRPFERFQQGSWIKQDMRSEVSGYRINKIFSTAVSIKELVSNFEEGLNNAYKLQRFYNGDLGLAYTSEGAKITREMLFKITKQYNLKAESSNPCLCGIDVGNSLTTVIGEMIKTESGIKIKIVFAQNMRTFEDIQEICSRFNIKCGIIDSRPESRLSRRVVSVYKQFFMADYSVNSVSDSFNAIGKIYRVDRTQSMDAVKEMIALELLEIPDILFNNEEFVNQITANTRIWQQKENSIEGRYVWVEGNQADHFHHACFEAGTMIITETGEIPIEDVKAGMRVLTRHGFKEVEMSEMTGIQETNTYFIDSTTEIKSTENHPIWTILGFRPLKELLTRRAICCSLSKKERFTWEILTKMKLFLMGLSLEDIQNLKTDRIEFITQQVQIISKKVLEDFIKRYGKKSMEKSRKDMPYITKMVIRLIMISITWNVFIEKNILVNILKNIVKTIKKGCLIISTGLGYCLKNGIKPKKELCFIRNKQSIYGNIPIASNVKFVAKNIQQPKRMGNFVVKNVYQKTAEIPALIMSCVFVLSVIKSIRLISIRKENTVKTAEERKNKTYNLRVIGCPEYFANGLLVHNCNYMNLAKKLLLMLKE